VTAAGRSASKRSRDIVLRMTVEAVAPSKPPPAANLIIVV
jgi:hypothetical protein